MKFLARVFVAMMACFIITDSYAEMYSNVTVTRVTVKSDTAKVKPYAASVKIGYRFARSLSLEAQYGGSMRDDDLAGGKVDIDKLSAIFLRIGGESAYNGVRSYLLIGTSKTELKYTDVATPGEDKVEGTAWGIGLEEYSSSVKNMAYNLEYVQYADEDDTKLTGISFGLRYWF